MKLPKFNCKRCSYQWIPREEKEPKVCPDCNSPYWNKERRHGGSRIGKRNPLWKGEKAGYAAKHVWLMARHGKANKCEKCGVKNGKYEWANVSGKYKRERSDYIQLCATCHRFMDRKKQMEGVRNYLTRQKEQKRLLTNPPINKR